MTAQIVYHHSNGATIDFDTTSLPTDYDFGPKQSAHKNNKGDTVINDPNRVHRIFTCNAVLNTADLVELDGYARPATAPTISNAYPKIVWTMDDVPTTKTILCTIVGFHHDNKSNGFFNVQVTFKERYKT